MTTLTILVDDRNVWLTTPRTGRLASIARYLPPIAKRTNCALTTAHLREAAEKWLKRNGHVPAYYRFRYEQSCRPSPARRRSC